MDGLRTAIPDLRGVLLASSEELPIAPALGNGSDANRIAAMAAAASSLGCGVSGSLSAGTLEGSTVSGNDGQILLVPLEGRGVARELRELFN